MKKKRKMQTLAQRCNETGMTPEEAWRDLYEEANHAADMTFKFAKQVADLRDEVAWLKRLCRLAADSYPNATRETGLWDLLREAGKE